MMRRAILIGFILIATVATYFAVSPHIALRGLRSAIAAGDSAALEDRVDFPRVREDLKAQVNAEMLKQTGSDLKDNPFNPLALGLASKLVEGMVDSFITPAGIASLARGDNPNLASSVPTASHSSNEPFANARVTRDALDRFSVWVPNDEEDEVRFVFHRYGLSWKLTGITIPIDE